MSPPYEYAFIDLFWERFSLKLIQTKFKIIQNNSSRLKRKLQNTGTVGHLQRINTIGMLSILFLQFISSPINGENGK
jgi:hypothetical protein